MRNVSVSRYNYLTKLKAACPKSVDQSYKVSNCMNWVMSSWKE